jgi:hypothetical protein
VGALILGLFAATLGSAALTGAMAGPLAGLGAGMGAAFGLFVSGAAALCAVGWGVGTAAHMFARRKNG